MYQELLYVVNNQLGKRKVGSDEISPGDLIVYGQKVFSLILSIIPRHIMGEISSLQACRQWGSRDIAPNIYLSFCFNFNLSF